MAGSIYRMGVSDWPVQISRPNGKASGKWLHGQSCKSHFSGPLSQWPFSQWGRSGRGRCRDLSEDFRETFANSPQNLRTLS